MLPRFHWSDITTVGHFLGVLILLTGASMVVPAVVALAFGEHAQLGAYVAGIGICAFLGSALRLLKSSGIDRRRSILLVGFGWIVIGVIASIPLYLSGSYETWFDSLFDSVSALTSTGVSIANDIDGMSNAQVTWHVIMSYMGAQAVIIIALYCGFFGEGSKLHVRHDSRAGKRTATRIGEIWRLVARVFGALALVGTIAASIVCFMLGFSPVDAVMNGFWLATCAVGTSGFVPHTSDLLYYHCSMLQLVLSVLMIAGALSFGVYMLVRRQQYRQVCRNSEMRVYMIWIAILVIFVTAIMTREDLFTTLGGLVSNGLMTVISAATTCGMQTVYPEQMGGAISEGVVIWVIVAMLFGACAYSTGGGIKTVRILQVLHWIRYSILLRLASDNAHVRVKYEQFGSRDLSAKDATVAMTIFIMYLAAAALGSMAFIAYGNDALNSVFEAISYLSNCGLTTSITQQGLPIGLKVVSLLLMWFGRIEFIALIAAIVGIIMSLHPENLFSNVRSRDLRLLKKRNRGGTAWRRRKGQGPKQGTTLVVSCLLAGGLACAGLGMPLAQAVTDTTGGAQIPAEEVEGLGDTNAYHAEAIRALLSASARQDGRAVSIQGEAIGQALYADADHKWVNLKQDVAMIGVYMTNEQAAAVTSYGAYGQTGDTVAVNGQYHLACAAHKGELEVHADSVDVTAPGAHWQVQPTLSPYVWGIALLALGAGLTLLRRRLHDKPLFGFRS